VAQTSDALRDEVLITRQRVADSVVVARGRLAVRPMLARTVRRIALPLAVVIVAGVAATALLRRL
jgi:hypothetical protein